MRGSHNLVCRYTWCNKQTCISTEWGGGEVGQGGERWDGAGRGGLDLQKVGWARKRLEYR